LTQGPLTTGFIKRPAHDADRGAADQQQKHEDVERGCREITVEAAGE